MSDPEMKSIYLPKPARIVRSTAVTARERLFEVRFEDGARLSHTPGQFVEVSVLGVGESPISVSSSPTRSADGFEMCIRKVGNVTTALHNLPAGSPVGIRGPFGRGFPVKDMEGFDILFVAGGLGLVPLRSLIDNVVDNREKFGRLRLCYGSRTPSDMLFPDDLARWASTEGFSVETTVDVAEAGWNGNVGAIPRLLSGNKVDRARTIAVIVGPPVMFRFVIRAVLNAGVSESRIFMSLERRMKCGLGKCGHCQIDGIYVCQSGPVYPYTDVRNLKEAF